MDPNPLADQIRAALPDVKQGAPRFWGVWHTKPFDSYFLISDCQAEGRQLLLNLIDVNSLSFRYPDGLTRKHELLLHDHETTRLPWASGPHNRLPAGNASPDPKVATIASAARSYCAGRCPGRRTCWKCGVLIGGPGTGWEILRPRGGPLPGGTSYQGFAEGL